MLAAVLVLSLAGACGDPDDEVVVLVAASLTDVAADLAAAWDGGIILSEGGSQVLAAQIRAGAPADLLLSADPEIAEALAADGYASAPTPLAWNGLAIVTGSGGVVDDVTDLARDELRVVLADASVPLGGYTRQALRRLERSGLAPARFATDVLEGADSFEDDARTVLAKVTTGEADAAIVYRTDAAAAGRTDPDVRTIAWPSEADVTATYTAQVVDSGTASAADLQDFLQSPQAAEIWRAHGFVPVTDP